MTLICGPLNSVDIENMAIGCRERRSLQKEFYTNILSRIIKLYVAAVTWESEHSNGLDQINEKDQNNLIRLAQIRNMECSYQMDSWHSCQLGLEVRKGTRRHWWFSECEQLLMSFSVLASPECGWSWGGWHAYLIACNTVFCHACKKWVLSRKE